MTFLRNTTTSFAGRHSHPLSCGRCSEPSVVEEHQDVSLPAVSQKIRTSGSSLLKPALTVRVWRMFTCLGGMLILLATPLPLTRNRLINGRQMEPELRERNRLEHCQHFASGTGRPPDQAEQRALPWRVQRREWDYLRQRKQARL